MGDLILLEEKQGGPLGGSANPLASGASQFVDPFDELAAVQRSPAASDSSAPGSSGIDRSASQSGGAAVLVDGRQLRPVDPLEALWVDANVDPLGASSLGSAGSSGRQPSSQASLTLKPPPGPSGLSRVTHHHHQPSGSAGLPAPALTEDEFWDFVLAPASGASHSEPRSHAPSSTAQRHGSQAALGTSSTGDLLGLEPFPDEQASTSSTGAGGRGSHVPAGAAGSGSSAPAGSRAKSEGNISGMGGSSSQQQQTHRDASNPPAAVGSSKSEGTTGNNGESSGSTGAEGAQGNGQHGQGQGQGQGQGDTEVRELLIYAIPLLKERFVFLPVAGWKEQEKPPQPGIAGSLSTGLQSVSDRMASWWQSLGNKEPDTIAAKIYQHGQAIVENMTAEERLMRNIPKAANKLVIYHPSCTQPTEVAEQLHKMTSAFTLKATGKAAAAGLLLPVAVGIEIIAIPGTGWYTLYQLYKASTSAKGGQRLNKYLNHDPNVRVCYAAEERLDKYIERAHTNPDGLLGQDDVDDLCHELGQPDLHHPLSELRSRYLKRIQQKTGDYALLPANDAAADDAIEGGFGNREQERKKKGWLPGWVGGN